jgi:hypothetical protein
LLDKPVKEGGMGLNSQTATKFAALVEEVVEKANYIRQEEMRIKKDDVGTLKGTVNQMRKSILEEFEGNLTLDQVEALNKGIEFRIFNKISRKEFQEYLGTPFEHGGVGLGGRSARNLARKMELIMLVGFGK